MYLNININVNTYNSGLTFLCCPVAIFTIVYEIIPKTIPSAIEYVNGIAAIVMNAGIATEKSSQLIFFTAVDMNIPTTIRAGAVAAEGTNRNSGLKNSEIRKKHPVITDVSPVRPPAATPADDSTNVVTVDVPSNDPNVVPIASDKSAFPALGKFPFSSREFVLEATPASVPTVSNISTNRNVNIEIISDAFNMFFGICTLNATFSNPDGILKNVKSAGICVTPIGMPITVVMIIPNRIAPFTFLATNTAVIIMPSIASNVDDWVIFPSESIVAPSPVIMPALLNPINAMKNPIPTEIDSFKSLGIELKIVSLILKNESKIKIIPSSKIINNASCHLNPYFKQTVYVKYAERPIPGARAKGYFANNPMIIVATPAEIAVAMNTPLKSIPVLDNISGFRNNM